MILWSVIQILFAASNFKGNAVFRFTGYLGFSPEYHK